MSSKNRKNFFMIDNDFVKLYARHLGVYCTAVYTSLSMHANSETGRCWPMMVTIGKQHNIERHTVSRALEQLERWNIIKIDREADRKNRIRKNNVYTLLPKAMWKKISEEDKVSGTALAKKSRGTPNTSHMVSQIPQDGIESASNKTHITKPREENPNCGQEPTVINKENSKIEGGGPLVWDSEKAIDSLLKSDYKDYRIIGEYFKIKAWSFVDREACKKEVERALKPAQLLKNNYRIEIIRKTMDWCEEAFGSSMGWTLEAVVRNIDDCIDENFRPLKQQWELRIAASDSAKAEGLIYVPGKYKNIPVTKMR